MHKLLPVLLLIFLVPVVHAQNAPTLLFSDMTSAPISGWSAAEPNKGAAITVWGYNLGDSRGSSYITVNGVDLTSDSDYAVWGEYWPTQYWQRITFWLNSNIPLEEGGISVTVDGEESNAVNFTTRNTGNMYFISSTASDGDGSHDDPFNATHGRKGAKYVTQTMQKGDIFYFRGGVYDKNMNRGIARFYMRPTDPNGTAQEPIAFAAYPGELPEIRIEEFSSNSQNGFELKGKYQSISGFKIDSEFRGVVMAGDYGRLVGNEIIGIKGNYGSGTGIVSLGDSARHTGDDIIMLGNSVSGGRSKNRFDHSIYIKGCSDNGGVKVGWNYVFDSDFARGPLIVINHQQDRCLPDTQILDAHFIFNNIVNCDAARAIAIHVGSVSYSVGEPEPEPQYVYNNVIDKCGQDSAALTTSNSRNYEGGQILGSGQGHSRFYNNVIYRGGYRGLYSGTGASTGLPLSTVFKNNIVWMEEGHADDSTVYVRIKQGAESVTELSHNLYYGLGEYTPCATCVDDSDNVNNQDPLFIDPENGDFRLQNNSPARGMGTDNLVFEIAPPAWAPINRDIGYILRTGNYDIGAYAFGSQAMVNDTNSPSLAINNSPVITSIVPNTLNRMNKSMKRQFSVNAMDSDNDVLTYSWYVNGTLNRTGKIWNLNGTRFKKGTWNITAIVTDGNTSDTHTWTFKIRTPKKQDITDDDVVDVRDLRIIAKHVIKKKAWRAQYDQNNDGIVNIFDLISVIREFGTY